MTTISLVIPAKNECNTIAEVIQRIVNLGIATEILVVDDGSSDDTPILAAVAGARIISHPYSLGNGAAVKTGARHATGEILVFLDGDGQHAPEDIPRMLELLEQGYDMVVGARQNGSHAGLHRGLANRFYNRFASWMVGHPIPDLTSGFRAVRADKFREFLHLLPNGFSYPTTVTMAFFRAAYPVGYVPIHAARRSGKSHIRPFRDGIRFLLIIFKIGTLYSPLKLFLPIALLFFIVGTGYSTYTIGWEHRFTNMGALLLFDAVLVFLIGLVSEQITALTYDRQTH